MNKKLGITGFLTVMALGLYLAYESLKAVDWDLSDLAFEDDEDEISRM